MKYKLQRMPYENVNEKMIKCHYNVRENIEAFYTSA